MADNRHILTQMATRAAAIPSRTEPEPDDVAGQVDHLGPFGCLRGVRERAVMLELRRKNGCSTALGYTWLERIDFDPSLGITLKFAGQRVTLRGRNLNAEIRPQLRLLDELLRHRVVWIQEADEPALLRADCLATVVERIELE